jgi:KRAB domain-containing zinc finger protein
VFIREGGVREHLTHAPPALRCPDCDRTFPSPYELNRHAVSHSQLRPHACAVEGCGYAAKTLDTLRSHARNAHGERHFPCAECGKVFTRKQGLRQHAAAHAQKPLLYTGVTFACNYCGKVFASAAALTTHAQAHHASLESHACALCPKTFQYSSTLKKHVLVTHGPQRQFPCTQCAFKVGMEIKIQMIINWKYDLKPVFFAK